MFVHQHHFFILFFPDVLWSVYLYAVLLHPRRLPGALPFILFAYFSSSHSFFIFSPISFLTSMLTLYITCFSLYSSLFLFSGSNLCVYFLSMLNVFSICLRSYVDVLVCFFSPLQLPPYMTCFSLYSPLFSCSNLRVHFVSMLNVFSICLCSYVDVLVFLPLHLPPLL